MARALFANAATSALLKDGDKLIHLDQNDPCDCQLCTQTEASTSTQQESGTESATTSSTTSSSSTTTTTTTTTTSTTPLTSGGGGTQVSGVPIYDPPVPCRSPWLHNPCCCDEGFGGADASCGRECDMVCCCCFTNRRQGNGDPMCYARVTVTESGPCTCSCTNTYLLFHRGGGFFDDDSGNVLQLTTVFPSFGECCMWVYNGAVVYEPCLDQDSYILCRWDPCDTPNPNWVNGDPDTCFSVRGKKCLDIFGPSCVACDNTRDIKIIIVNRTTGCQENFDVGDCEADTSP